MKHRLEALLSFLPVFFAIKENRTNDAKFTENLAAARTQFLLYCYNDEIEQYEQIVSAIEAKDNQAYTDAVRKTIILVKNRVRKELGLDKHTADEKAEKA
jgi:DNA-binding FadR family transcriptional regulator